MVGCRVNKRGFLADLYATANQSIGLAVAEDSKAILMFRVMLAEHQHLCPTRAAIEHQADQALQSHPDYQRREPCREWDRFLRSRFWLKPGTCAGFRITDNSTSSVGSISARSSPDSSVG